MLCILFLSCFWKCKHLKSLVCIFCSFCWSWLVCNCAWLLLAVVWTFDLKLTFRIILKLTASAVFFQEHLALGYLGGVPVCFLINTSRSHTSGFVLHYVIVVVNLRHHVRASDLSGLLSWLVSTHFSYWNVNTKHSPMIALQNSFFTVILSYG